MRTAYAVIGSNYGDEGKGVTVHALAKRLKEQGQNPVVIRHNGTAQAAHTVCRRNPDGSVTEHVFSHFGAGTLAGVPTYLAPTFYCHPAAFIDEMDSLLTKGVDLYHILWADPNCPVVTPFDVALNRMQESQRGNLRHGSCGMGMFSAFKRESCGLRFNLHEARGWAKQRQFPVNVQQYYADTAVSMGFKVDDLWAMVDAMGLRFWEGVEQIDMDSAADIRTMIFEGAQGLALDPKYGKMPHCTPSNCGLQNVVSLLADIAPYTDLSPIYVTRTYLSRHGAGPLPSRQGWQGFMKTPEEMLADDTNKPNRWQGEIRYAPLDDSTYSRISRDLDTAYGAGFKSVNPSLSITWLDALAYSDWFVTSALGSVQRHAPAHHFRLFGVGGGREDVDYALFSDYGSIQDCVHATEV
jgi:adenylosuccinate synthase